LVRIGISVRVEVSVLIITVKVGCVGTGGGEAVSVGTIVSVFENVCDADGAGVFTGQTLSIASTSAE
jgi:hypothetical protein